MNKLNEIIAFSNLIFQGGKDKGIEDMEVYVEATNGLSIKAFNGEIDSYSVSNERIISLRGFYEGKHGNAYTERFETSAIEDLLKNLIECAQNNDNAQPERMADGTDIYYPVSAYNADLEHIMHEEKIAFVLELEKLALSLDPLVKTVGYNGYEEEHVRKYIINTKGLSVETAYNVATSYLSVVAEKEGDIKTGTYFYTGNCFSEFSPSKIAERAVQDAVGALGAQTTQSGQYEVILRNNVAAVMLDVFAPIFNADQVQKQLSLLKGKLHQVVASPCINLFENPLMENGARSRAFDDEGTPSISKYLIKKGILETYLHNHKTAIKDEVASTGNGIKNSPKGVIGTFATNMYIENGSTSYEKMSASMESGIVIIDVQGTHAGMDAISGDFSLQASGFLIENGKAVRPLHQIIIAGNFYELLENILEVGDDLCFNLPYISYIGSPSLKVSGITVAGL